MTVRSRGGRARWVTVAAVVTAGVAGCSAQSGAAAVVEGVAIPVSDVHEATAQLSPFLQDLTPSTVLLLLMAEPTFGRVAAENGIGVSDQEAQDVLDGLVDPAVDPGSATAATEFGPAARTVARFTLLQQRLGESPDGPALLEEITDELAALDVDVNPRYGEIDFAGTEGLTPVEHDWLVPAPAPVEPVAPAP